MSFRLRYPTNYCRVCRDSRNSTAASTHQKREQRIRSESNKDRVVTRRNPSTIRRTPTARVVTRLVSTTCSLEQKFDGMHSTAPQKRPTVAQSAIRCMVCILFMEHCGGQDDDERESRHAYRIHLPTSMHRTEKSTAGARRTNPCISRCCVSGALNSHEPHRRCTRGHDTLRMCADQIESDKHENDDGRPIGRRDLAPKFDGIIESSSKRRAIQRLPSCSRVQLHQSPPRDISH